MIQGDAPVVETEAAPVEPTGFDAISAADSETEHSTAWKAKQAERIEALEAESSKLEAELATTASTELADWEKKHASAKENRASDNKDNESAFIAKRDETTSGNEWSRVAFLVDFTGKAKTTKDTSRMKSCLIQLKQEGLLNR